LLQYVEQSPEVFTTIPQSFDALQERALKILRSSAVDRSTLDLYLNEYRLIRKEAFTLWLEGLRLGAAVVNLPQWGRVYAGRVVEGMAAGRPVITREMPDRPLAKAAFEDGKEILLYREPHELAEHLRRIISEPSFGEGIAHNARRRLHASHTTEGYIAHLLEWLKS
jgi:glycosyltransferase involved in cell wall biosynthesis